MAEQTVRGPTQSGEQVERDRAAGQPGRCRRLAAAGRIAAARRGTRCAAACGTSGMALIGAASLWRAYRTTLRLYTGQFTPADEAGAPAPAAAVRPPATARAGRAAVGRIGLLERRLPWLSEQAAAIALAQLSRRCCAHPEAKMMLLTPSSWWSIFGGMFLRGSTMPPVAVRPLIAIGAMAMVLLTMMQLVGNQFGFDRGGFRVFVLSPGRRGDILLGKNLAVAPLALALSAGGAVGFVQVVYPMRLDHFLAVLPQMLSMYLLFCLLANCCRSWRRCRSPRGR